MPAPPPQIASAAEPLDTAALVAAGFATVVHRVVVDSTMDEARRLADDAALPLPAVIVADRQAAGRGRRGAGWWQAEGALAASLVIGGEDRPPRPTWSLACGVALAETIRALEPRVAARVRWPNDIEAAGHKLAGILLETAPHGRTVVGIGVNTSGSAAAAPADLRHRVGTLPDIVGRPLDRSRLLAALWPTFRDLLAAVEADPGGLVHRYAPLCALEGAVVTLHAGTIRHTGICRGITPSGALVLDTSAGRVECTSGSLTDPAEVWPGPVRPT